MRCEVEYWQSVSWVWFGTVLRGAEALRLGVVMQSMVSRRCQVRKRLLKRSDGNVGWAKHRYVKHSCGDGDGVVVFSLGDACTVEYCRVWHGGAMASATWSWVKRGVGDG